MLQSISWSQYITAMLFALICYYGYVALKYFRWEILSLIGIKRIEEKGTPISVSEIKKQFTSSNHTDFLPKEYPVDATIIFQPFWDEANAYLAEMKLEAQKEEILFAVKMIVEKYPGLHSAEHKQGLETAISGLIAQYYPERFTATDIQNIWH
ncbi:MAG: hypothetical protein ACRCSM_09825 [Sediminibacterium sp.]|jgi:hypothetical protein|uniref:hypothetical protein n=1 Tax=Asinibacterium sp. OR53 TaxID=925409 RepID=UPI0012F8ED5D|nr:hypothetical protein [Asinibacterium sp. OR53]MBR2647959.1 hypothetical protein [Sediminibacterium sp.]MCA6438984.1 hypothetical protein [Chitinophagaceae bacterium]MCA6445636.1 hypothetical protein [Chitinophagaceae bacterium]